MLFHGCIKYQARRRTVANKTILTFQRTAQHTAIVKKGGRQYLKLHTEHS